MNIAGQVAPPLSPFEPGRPGGPAGPVAPVAPVSPVAPVAPVGPVEMRAVLNDKFLNWFPIVGFVLYTLYKNVCSVQCALNEYCWPSCFTFISLWA